MPGESNDMNNRKVIDLLQEICDQIVSLKNVTSNLSTSSSDRNKSSNDSRRTPEERKRDRERRKSIYDKPGYIGPTRTQYRQNMAIGRTLGQSKNKAVAALGKGITNKNKNALRSDGASITKASVASELLAKAFQTVTYALNTYAKYEQISFELRQKLRGLENQSILNEISYRGDLVQAQAEMLSMLAQSGKELSNRTYLNAIETSITSIFKGVNEGAYAALNKSTERAADAMLLDVEAAYQQQKFELEKAQKRVAYEQQKYVIGAETEEAQTKYKTERLALTAQVGADVTSALVNNIPLPSIQQWGAAVDAGGKLLVSAAELHKQQAQNAAAEHTTIMKNQQEQYNMQMKYETNLSKTKLENEKKIQEMNIKAAQEQNTMYNQMAQNLENISLKFDKAIVDMGVSMGYNGEQLDKYKKIIMENQVAMSLFGKTAEDMVKLQATYVENTGRNIQLSNNGFLSSFAMGRLIGENETASLVSGMELFNHSVEDTNETLFEMYKEVGNIGLNARRYAKDLVRNLGLAERYQFKGGTRGMMEMAKWAQNVRFSLDSVNSMLDKVHEGGLEGVITQGAQMQVLGGQFAMGADPLAMAFESYMDPQGYAERMNRMIANLGIFNSKTGETEFGIADQMRIEAFAKASGQNAKDVLNQIRQQNKRSMIDKNLNNAIGFTEDERALIANRAQYSNGEWRIMMNDNTEKSVNQLQRSDLDRLKPIDNEEKLVEYVRDIRDMMTKSEEVRTKAQSKMLSGGYETQIEEVAKRNAQVMDEFNAKFDEYMTKYIEKMGAATEAQKDMLSIMGQGNTGIDDMTKKIAENGEQIADTLEKVNEELNQRLIELGLLKAPTVEEAKAAVRGYDENYNIMQSLQEMSQLEKQLGDIKESYGKDTPWNKTWFQVFKDRGDEEAVKIFDTLKKDVETYNEYIRLNKDYNAKEINWTRIMFENSSKTKWGTGEMEHFITPEKTNVQFQNEENMATPLAATDVTQINDGMATLVSPNVQDSAIFAKQGGPFDTLFTDIFGRVNSIYDNMADNSSIKVEPIKIDLSGRLELTGDGRTIDIMNDLQNNPILLRSLTQMISQSLSSKLNGGKSVFNGNNNTYFT